MAVTSTDTSHDPGCSGCPTCSAELAGLLDMTSAQYARWLRTQTSEAARRAGMSLPPGVIDAAEHMAETSAVACEGGSADHFRAALATYRRVRPSVEAILVGAPDSWDEALRTRMAVPA
jgi:hypothetical protein